MFLYLLISLTLAETTIPLFTPKEMSELNHLKQSERIEEKNRTSMKARGSTFFHSILLGAKADAISVMRNENRQSVVRRLDKIDDAVLNYKINQQFLEEGVDSDTKRK